MLINYTQRIIGYSAVNIVWVSDQYCFYYNFREIEQWKIHLCYYIFKYDDNRTFDVYVSFMSLIVIFLTMSKSVICCHYCHNYFEAVKYLHKVPFPILIYTTIGKNKIRTINFGRRTNLHLLFFYQWVRKSTWQCLSTITSKLHSSIISK